MKEEWKLVEQFEELAPNKIVKLINCKICHASEHVYILNEYRQHPDYGMGYTTMFDAPDGNHLDLIGEFQINEKRLFILINDDDLKEDEKEIKKLEKTKSLKITVPGEYAFNPGPWPRPIYVDNI